MRIQLPLKVTARGLLAYNESLDDSRPRQAPRLLALTAMKRIGTSIVNLPGRGLIGAVRLYQLVISPWLGPACRFQPSCSNYMIQAVEKYGFMRGVWKGVRRIARCHPLGTSGYDPP